MLQATAGQVKESQRKPVGAKSAHGSRTRPTNNQLLYRATFQWEHYTRSLYGSPKLPTATEACASVTSAFLQVVGVLFEVERLREEQPRNILRLLSTNTRRTKVVELSSGTHRVPEELKRHSIGDGEGGQYSTNLDRNRYGSDDQYLATVVRYNLEYLDLCPCLVDVTILDAKGGEVAVVVSAGAAACSCRSGGMRLCHQPDIRQRTIRTIGNRVDSEEDLREGGPGRERTPLSPSAPSGEAAKADRRLEAAAPSKSNGGSELFDALLMAAAEPQVTSRRKPSQPRALTRSPDSNRESEDEGLRRGASDGALRRSSRKSVKLFNAAALEREGSAGSRDSLSAQSMEDDTESTPHLTKQGYGDDWDGSFQPSRGGRRIGGPQRGASAANLAKLSVNTMAPEASKLQQEVARMREQLHATSLMLDLSKAQEAEAQQQIRHLQQELALSKASGRDEADGQALKAVAGMLKTGGQQEGKTCGKSPPPDVPESILFSAVVLKEAQLTIAKLQKEKAALCNTLSAAGLPLPFPPGDILTPQRNGESTANGFGPSLPHMGTPGNSAFSVPLAVQAFPTFHTYQRALTSMAPASLKSPLIHLAPESPRLGSQTPGSMPKVPALQTAGRERLGAPTREQSSTPPARGSSTPSKRKLEESAFNQQYSEKPAANGKLHPVPAAMEKIA